ncbi:MAG: alginate export family protein, partial [Mariprofundaceae bacterium]|nr:alginate export family protein [Mariprofundaceae bacterium]
MNEFSKQIRLFPLLAAAMLFGGQLAGAVDISVGGSLRPRVEFVDEGAQGQAVGQSKTHTTMQTRINVKATVDDDVSAFIQIQDVRTWGGEAGSAGLTGPAGGAGPAGAPPSITRSGTSTSGQLDLHQAYFIVKNALNSGVDLKIGRQEMVFDEHRLIGNIGWIQQAQTFDVARLDFDLAALKMTAFYAETVSKDTHPTLAHTVAGATIESRFYGVRATYGLGGKDRITPYFYYSENPNGIFVATLAPVGAGTTPGSMQSLATAGVYFLKHFGDFRFRFDGAYQFGDESPTVDISAYM